MFRVEVMGTEDVRECVKLLFLCVDELNLIFGDEYTGREILERYYRSIDKEGLFVVKVGERVAGFTELNLSGVKRKLPFRDFLVLGFSKGLKARLLIDFFN